MAQVCSSSAEDTADDGQACREHAALILRCNLLQRLEALVDGRIVALDCNTSFGAGLFFCKKAIKQNLRGGKPGHTASVSGRGGEVVASAASPALDSVASSPLQ